MKTFDFAGKSVLVTGAGKGIGAGCAAAFAEAGADVIAVARTESDLNSVKEASKGNIEVWCEDVTKQSFLDRMSSLNQLDVLVNNVGFNQPEPITAVKAETLDAMLNLNVRSIFLASQIAVRLMQANGGSIVQMSSQMGQVGSPNRTVYCMTKHALEGLAKAMAVELAPQGIRVNSVCPTFVETPQTKPFLANKAFAEFVQNSIPMGQLGEIEDVVNAVMFLASPLSRMTTGHALLVDGGWTAQ